jgi:hypothetical protein
MRHLKARQMLEGSHAGKWHYTSCSSRGGYAIGYCSEIKPCPDCNADGEKLGNLTDIEGGCPTCKGRQWVQKADAERCFHDTAEEAQEHYRQYLLDHARFYPASGEEEKVGNTLHRCQAPGCQAFTAGAVYVKGSWHFDLCADHRNRETLAQLVPSIGEAWES